MNSVILSGRLTKKPELRATQSGKSICNFILAVNRYASEETDFIECTCFNRTAENLVKYQDKGSLIELKGQIQNNNYTNKDGKTLYKTIIIVELINYISQGKTKGYEAKNEQKNPYEEMGNRIKSDSYELPF